MHHVRVCSGVPGSSSSAPRHQRLTPQRVLQAPPRAAEHDADMTEQQEIESIEAAATALLADWERVVGQRGTPGQRAEMRSLEARNSFVRVDGGRVLAQNSVVDAVDAQRRVRAHRGEFRGPLGAERTGATVCKELFVCMREAAQRKNAVRELAATAVLGSGFHAAVCEPLTLLAPEARARGLFAVDSDDSDDDSDGGVNPDKVLWADARALIGRHEWPGAEVSTMRIAIFTGLARGGARASRGGAITVRHCRGALQQCRCLARLLPTTLELHARCMHPVSTLAGAARMTQTAARGRRRLRVWRDDSACTSAAALTRLARPLFPCRPPRPTESNGLLPAGLQATSRSTSRPATRCMRRRARACCTSSNAAVTSRSSWCACAPAASCTAT